jgi:DNA recombination protein RmuC
MLAVQVLQSVVRDARMREQAHLIQNEVRHLLGDVSRLRDRAVKLETHLRQAQEDASGVSTSAEKIARRGERIDQLEFERPDHPQPATGDLFRAAE